MAGEALAGVRTMPTKRRDGGLLRGRIAMDGVEVVARCADRLARRSQQVRVGRIVRGVTLYALDGEGRLRAAATGIGVNFVGLSLLNPSLPGLSDPAAPVEVPEGRISACAETASPNTSTTDRSSKQYQPPRRRPASAVYSCVLSTYWPSLHLVAHASRSRTVRGGRLVVSGWADVGVVLGRSNTKRPAKRSTT